MYTTDVDLKLCHQLEIEDLWTADLLICAPTFERVAYAMDLCKLDYFGQNF